MDGYSIGMHQLYDMIATRYHAHLGTGGHGLIDVDYRGPKGQAYTMY